MKIKKNSTTKITSYKGKFPVSKYFTVIPKGYKVESVLVERPEKNIICFSSQVGCHLNCKFCMAGEFVSNLSSSEMVSQCEIINNDINNDKPILFSCMGVGEPTCNSFAVFCTFKKLHEIFPNAKFSISSTAFNYWGLEKLSELDIDIKFQLSVHAINRKTRETLFGFNHPLSDLLKVRKVINENNKKIDQNYILIKGKNDSKDDAQLLAEICGMYPIKINQYNKIPKSNFEPSDKVDEFINVLKEMDCEVEYYQTDGDEIQAACGQLIGGNYE